MPSIGLASNVEVLVRILWELFEEQSEEGIDVFASSYRVANTAATVGIADINRLVQEYDRCVRIPGVRVID